MSVPVPNLNLSSGPTDSRANSSTGNFSVTTGGGSGGISQPVIFAALGLFGVLAIVFLIRRK